jgi:hypothetical protein
LVVSTATEVDVYHCLPTVFVAYYPYLSIALLVAPPKLFSFRSVISEENEGRGDGEAVNHSTLLAP